MGFSAGEGQSCAVWHPMLHYALTQAIISISLVQPPLLSRQHCICRLLTDLESLHGYWFGKACARLVTYDNTYLKMSSYSKDYEDDFCTKTYFSLSYTACLLV